MCNVDNVGVWKGTFKVGVPIFFVINVVLVKDDVLILFGRDHQIVLVLKIFVVSRIVLILAQFG